MLDMVSFIGVDSWTNCYKLEKLDKLAKLTNKLDVEFGFLYSEAQAGVKPRYPKLEEIMLMKDFFRRRQMAHSVHLCGQEAIDKFLVRDRTILNMCEGASRVQLNFNIEKYNQDALALRLIELAESGDVPSIVLQSNKSKKDFINKVKKLDLTIDLDWFNILYDASGGFGRTIDIIEPVDRRYYTGYAGGINPENLTSVIHRIDDVVGKDRYYIDMESGIRTNDKLDIQKVTDILITLLTH